MEGRKDGGEDGRREDGRRRIPFVPLHEWKDGREDGREDGQEDGRKDGRRKDPFCTVA